MQGLLDGSRIAVFHDDSGALAAPTAASAVAVYVRGEGDWSEGKRHSFSLTQGAGLSELREQMQTLAANLGDCRIVVGAEDHAAGLGIDFLNGAALVHGQNAFRNPVKNAAVALFFLKSLAPCLHNVNDAVKKTGRYFGLLMQINKGQTAFLGRPAGNIAANNNFKPPLLGLQHAFFKTGLVAVQDYLRLKPQ